MSRAPTPIQFEWDGEAFHPAGQYWAARCDEQFVIGEKYRLIEHQDRSSATHNHYFAAIHDAWLNLPEHLTEEFPNEERLRKFALIKCGYADCHTIVCASEDDAKRTAEFIRPIDEFSIVIVRGRTVERYTAQSQSTRAMGAKDFQKSKQAVLDWIDDLLSIERGTISENAGMAA